MSFTHKPYLGQKCKNILAINPYYMYSNEVVRANKVIYGDIIEKNYGS